MTIYPFYRVFTETGEQYCDCGWEKHAQEIIILNKDVQRLHYKRIDAPKPINPETVDVGVIPTEELPGQQGLPKAKERLPFEPLEEELGLPQSELYEF
tara:strand:+ start:167 stop:460 length:294 start_codon:yes stop_codon:yes gene_type:complete